MPLAVGVFCSALLVLVILVAACSCQFYPSGPETAWTRASWPELKLPFPYKQLRSNKLEDDFALHSTNGPYNTQYYETLAAQRPKLPRGAASPMALPTDGKTLLRCSTCTILHTTVWETARHMVHSNGEVPTKRVLSQLLTSSCENEIPEIMKAVAAVSEQLGEMMSSSGASSIVAAYDPDKVATVCQGLKETAGGTSHPNVHLQALQRGLRQYVSQLNTQTVPSAGNAFFDLTPEADKCQDFHSECARWAAKGECQRNPNYMVGGPHSADDPGATGHCRFSCGICLARLPATGDLPRAGEAVELSAKWLGDVQFHACNASGICDGVDAGLLPRVATFPLGTDATLSKTALRRWLEGGAGAPASPTTRGGPKGALSDLRQLVTQLPRECFYRNTGWWTYELCHERHVKQFHVDLETARMEHVITLGTFNAESQPEQSEAQMLDTEFLLPGMLAKAYFSERYSGGSTCTLDNGTSIEREAEVRFACSPDAETHLTVHESEQCRYIIVLFSPLLCAESNLGVQADISLQGLNLMRQEL